MISPETLFSLGLAGEVLPAWTVIAYVVLGSIFVLLRKVMLYLVITHIFSIYWGFLLYWGAYLSGESAHTTAFLVYTFCGLAVVTLAIIAYFKERSMVSSAA